MSFAGLSGLVNRIFAWADRLQRNRDDRIRTTFASMNDELELASSGYFIWHSY